MPGPPLQDRTGARGPSSGAASPHTTAATTLDIGLLTGLPAQTLAFPVFPFVDGGCASGENQPIRDSSADCLSATLMKTRVNFSKCS